MNLFPSYKETYPIEIIKQHIDCVVRANYSAPGAVVKKIYAMSTEMEKGFLKQIDFKEKRILTVGSSCDQVFEYGLRGSRDITVMDANYMTPYFGELKLAALKALDREDFIAFFKRVDKSRFMSQKTYASLIRPGIQDEMVREIWDYVFKQDEWYIRNVFHYYEGTEPTYLENDENYNEVRRIIDQVSVRFCFAKVDKFYEYADGEYDFIDLSNILTYFPSNTKVEFFIAAEKLQKFLSVNGIMKLHYGAKQSEYDSSTVYSGTFMDKPVRHISCDDENLAIAVWDNDKEKYLDSHPSDELNLV